MFGGNSNWRGPAWMPVNLLIVRALMNFYTFFGDDFKVQCPTGTGPHMTLFEVAQELVRRLTGTFFCAMPTGHGPSTAGRPDSRTIRIGAT
jgi:ornithine carbamoyltransferase